MLLADRPFAASRRQVRATAAKFQYVAEEEVQKLSLELQAMTGKLQLILTLQLAELQCFQLTYPLLPAEERR